LGTHPEELQIVPEAQQLLFIQLNVFPLESEDVVVVVVVDIGGVLGANHQSYSLKLNAVLT
jgi:hypothetical protein